MGVACRPMETSSSAINHSSLFLSALAVGVCICGSVERGPWSTSGTPL